LRLQGVIHEASSLSGRVHSVFSIGLFIFAVNQSHFLIQLIVFGEVKSYPVSIIVIFLGFFLPLFFSVALWFFPVLISKGILKREMDQSIDPENKISIFFVMIVVLGLYLTFNALIDSVYYFALWQFTESSSLYGGFNDIFSPETKANIYATAIKLALGFILVFKSKSVAKKIFEIAI